MIIKSFLPEIKVDNEEILKDNEGVNIARLEKKQGLNLGIFCLKKKTSLDLAFYACEQLSGEELNGINLASSQNYQNKEILIVNDSSTDNSQEVINQHANTAGGQNDLSRK